jgi:hypothetical protein
MSSFFSSIRPILEALYFMSAIALAVFAYKGLEQLRITREIANKNTQREAFKLAAEQCRYFAEHIVPGLSKAIEEYKQFKMTCCANTTFKVVKGEIVDDNFNLELVKRDLSAAGLGLIGFLNNLEGFALFFVSGIAEETVGYRETAVAFCNQVRAFMPLIYGLRTRGARYESTVSLYEIWNNRLDCEALKRKKESIDAQLQGIENQTVKILGT